MKLMRFISPILFICTVACADSGSKEQASEEKQAAATPSHSPADSFERGKVIAPVLCRSNASQSYALYLPLGSTAGPLPVIYFFDPHGNGSLPLNKYKALADRYHFILVGSNNSKNGNDWPTAEIIWRNLSEDVRERIKINTDRIYACGFSGGAKVATYVGLKHNEIRGVIANGAALPEMVQSFCPFSFTAIAGEGDMNMTDLVAIDNELDRTKTQHRIILFDGKHEWAPESTMDIAFAGLELEAMKEKLIPQDSLFINRYVISNKKTVSEYLAKNNYVRAEANCKLAAELLRGLIPRARWFSEKDKALKNNPNYQKQINARQALLVRETDMKTQFEGKFQQGDLNYWTATIEYLRSHANASTPEGAMYQRLVAYLSLAFYSISNQLITNSRNQEAQHFVDLYKMDDPANNEAWYLSAVLKARNNDAKGAETDLMQAVGSGFTDKDRMLRQAEFKNLPINLESIAAKMNLNNTL